MRVALYTDELPDFSTLETQRCLVAMGLVAVIFSAESCGDTGTAPRFIKALEQDPFDVILYRYDPRSFECLAPLLSQHDSKLIVRYETSASLSQLRRYALPGYQIQRLELQRQLFSQWVQTHADQAQWMPESEGAMRDLERWKARNVPDKMLLTPPFTVLQEGLYAEQTANNKPPEKIQLLAAGRLSAEMGQTDIVAAFYRFVQSKPANQRSSISLTLLETGAPCPSLYPAEVKELIERLGLTDRINIAKSDPQLDHQRLMDCNAMITCLQGDERYMPLQVQAQALGIPIIELAITRLGLCEQVLALESSNIEMDADLISPAIDNPRHRRNLVVSGYKNISRYHAHDKIEQNILSQVLAVLLR